MAGVFGDYSQLFRLFHVINFVGVRFVSISSFASVIKRSARENPERELQLKKKKFSDTSGEEDSMFVAETASLLDLFPELSKEGTEVFKTSFHDFSVNCGIPIAAILVSKQENCRMCKKPYWTTSGKRQFETDCLEIDFLLSSEDTAVGLPLIRQCANLLIVGAAAFST